MRRYAVAALILLTAACTDESAVGPPVDRPLQSVVVSSDPALQILPPVARRQPNVPFDSTVPHVVEICRTTNGECAVRLRTFEVGGNNPNRGIDVDQKGKYFQVNLWFADMNVWIRPGDRFAVRIRSSLEPGAEEFGGFIVKFNPWLIGEITVDGERNPLPVLLLLPVPLRYRIKAAEPCEMLPNPTEDCLEVDVSNDGGTFINRDTTVGAQFPANALPAGVTNMTLVVDRYVPNPIVPGPLPPNTFCLPDTNPQYNGCYIFVTEPKIESFNETVEIAICPDYEAYSTLGSQINQVDLWKWDGIDEDTYQPLTAVETSFMECEEPLAPTGSASRSSSAFALARNALRPLAKLVMPTPLHAAAMRAKISPYGGGLNDFSTIGPVRRLRMETVTGDGANVMVGTTVTSSVRVLADGRDVASLNQGVSNVPVRFAVTNGTGEIVSVSEVTTNADGVASVQWNPGAGFNTLRAEGLNPRAASPFNIPGVWGSQIFSAVGQYYEAGIVFGVSFVSPMSKPAPGSMLTSDFSPLVSMQACAEDAVPRVCTTVPWSVPAVTFAPTSYHFTFASTTSMHTGAYSFTLIKDGVAFGLYTARARAAGETTAQGAADHAFTLGSTVEVAFGLTVRFFGAD